ncbi:MAG: carbamoyl phosphate synthase large subunit [Rhizobiales bacterium NRL2]|jgi:carbamoyl-phosphate synthase large subunit|nr:MAG: carbamoyl phosphate synthase large subunit [Rhizobiales bacterium NRL2]
MPKRTDIESIMIIGAGPIIIGQACEFDYSGTQACKALRDEGYRIILVNSNPATIMTDPEFADATYVEPVIPEVVARILEKERPDAILPTMGGQTALNTALALAADGTLERLGVELIGADREAIAMAEDRDLFRAAMNRIGLEMPRSEIATTLEEARAALEIVGLPTIVRPSFTLGGQGGGIAYNRDEFDAIVTSGLDASPAKQILIEESVLGWKEYEMEVVRDHADNCIIICSIENVDPMGVHTGDSITVAPALTLTDKEYQIMRDASIAVLREIGVDTGGSNVQFAVDPETGRLVVIEMNPRVSRSSALASKATGFPIAKVAAKLAVGYTLDELQNDITKVTPASFEPTIDYVVTKIPRFTFEKFPGAEPVLTTAMKSVGEAMAVGRSFHESLQKALRSMETGLDGLDDMPLDSDDEDALIAALGRPTPERLLLTAEALRFGLDKERIARITGYDPWFIDRLDEIVTAEETLRLEGLPRTPAGWLAVKKLGFGDRRIGKLTGTSESKAAAARRMAGIRPVYKRIDTCAAEFESETPYMYSTYEGWPAPDGSIQPAECESRPTDRRKIIILGGGPNRIGQGIEFDYCCVHAAFALKEAGYETIMVNCNPETVSTDYDTSDRLYFEPLTIETVLEIVRAEEESGEVVGAIVQFGGQTPLRLAQGLLDAGVPILGTSVEAIDRAEDRDLFQQMLSKLGLRQPPNGIARSHAEAQAVAQRLGFPVLLRPSYVLGGRAMEIVHDIAGLDRYIREAVKVSGANPVLVDSYLANAIEVDADVLSDGEDVFVAGIMEHIEEAGVHSGDSACALPPFSLNGEIIDEIKRQAAVLARELNVIGLMNVQFAVQDGLVYILEVNPRASRTVPFVAKTIGKPIAKIAARLMAGEKLATFGLDWDVTKLPYTAVKEAVFPFARFPGVDIILGPEMRSTGEVMGIARDYEMAFLKSQLGAGARLPTGGAVFISLRDSDKPLAVAMASQLRALGFSIVATHGTARYLNDNGIECRAINKVLEGRPHIVDALKNGEVQLVFNTTDGEKAIHDSFSLRRTALQFHIPYYTTAAGAKAAVAALHALKTGRLEVAPLQSYY